MKSVRFTAALLAFSATLALAACGVGGSSSTSPPVDPTFKPVPVSPVMEDVVLGNPDSKVKLIEYAAFTCPHCRDFAKQIYPRLKREYIDTGKISYVYRDFPLEIGPDGKAADGFGVILSSIARCKGPDKFYEMVDSVFGMQNDLMDAARKGEAMRPLTDLSAQHGMSVEEMRTCIDYKPELQASIKKSRDDATEKYKITGTPSILVNEQKVDNYSYEGVSAALDAALAGKPLPTADAEGAAPTSPSEPATPPAP